MQFFRFVVLLKVCFYSWVINFNHVVVLTEQAASRD